MSTQIILAVRDTNKDQLDVLSDNLDPHWEERGWPSALFETVKDSDDWAYTVYVPEDALEDARGVFADHAPHAAFQREEIPETDWIAETLLNLSPVRAGRFLVHGSHDREAARHAPVAVQIDAGQAFGTGHHGTTAGCLDMLERVLRLDHDSGRPRHALDIGAGSGVLAIAFAKTTGKPATASDIDPVCEIVARGNARINQVDRLVRCITATGMAHSALRPADLVFANILARPLEALARDLCRHVLPGGHVILSGLLPHQRARIVAAYRLQGLVLRHTHIREGWLTLLMRRP